jgi:hypothetical protein
MSGTGGGERRLVVAGRRDEGMSLLELALALALVMCVTGLLAPVTARVLDATRARHAAGFLASRVRLARQQAIASAQTTGLVFEKAGSRWTFRLCRDENGNGLRRADIDAGRDRCDPARHDLTAMFPGVMVGVDASLPGPDGEPGSDDAVRFGAGDIASFSPNGSCTSGTLFLRTTGGAQYAVRVAGVTARTRTLRYDGRGRRWLSW